MFSEGRMPKVKDLEIDTSILMTLIKGTKLSLLKQSKEIGVSQATLHRFVHGKQIPQKETLEKICKHYGINPNTGKSYDAVISDKVTYKFPHTNGDVTIFWTVEIKEGNPEIRFHCDRASEIDAFFYDLLTLEIESNEKTVNLLGVDWWEKHLEKLVENDKSEEWVPGYRSLGSELMPIYQIKLEMYRVLKAKRASNPSITKVSIGQ